MLAQLNPPKVSAAATDAAPLPVIVSDQLFGDRSLICIEHHGQRYYLRRTREDKLLLTK
ncbi:MAG: hemin uptake protein HemP [Gammaproteobacteria bacterium]|nr:hemin uptake protein HemP [Gammaproteobacteria bacterium]